MPRETHADVSFSSEKHTARRIAIQKQHGHSPENFWLLTAGQSLRFTSGGKAGIDHSNS